MNVKKIKKNYPYFYKTCLYLENTIFYKDIFKNKEYTGINYDLAEKFCKDAFKVSQLNWKKYFKKVFNLLELNVEFLKLQALLEKTGKYKYSSFKEVKENIYKNKNGNQLQGVDYLWGLYFSQIFWATHYKVFNFFIKEFVKKNKNKGFCLEAPSGTGIFLTHFLINNKNWSGVAVDLSESAINFTKKTLNFNKISLKKVKIKKQDIGEYQSNNKFDKIICGEFLEHVENPLGILKKINSLLAQDGMMFLTTVVWTAGIDHIYLYKNINEIKEHIKKGGFNIQKELVQNIFNKDKNNSDQNKKAILYAAILKKE